MDSGQQQNPNASSTAQAASQEPPIQAIPGLGDVRSPLTTITNRPRATTGGPAPFTDRDRSKFLQALDSAIQQGRRGS